MTDSLTERGDTRPCDGCGLLAGAGACRSLFQWNLPTRSRDVRYARRHRMAVDTYCLQHPDSYCASAKSLAAHLTGLCAAFECWDVEPALAAVQRWLSSNPPIKKPPLPEQRGALTIETVLAADSPDAYVEAVEAWARATWAAYAALHDVAREWIRAAGITRPADGCGRPTRPLRAVHLTRPWAAVHATRSDLHPRNAKHDRRTRDSAASDDRRFAPAGNSVQGVVCGLETLSGILRVH